MLARLEGNMAAREKIAIRRAIITYYRRKARGSKITLKELCEELGLNYQSVRSAKVDYDKTRHVRIHFRKQNTDDPNNAS